jgi:hypothetical protein
MFNFSRAFNDPLISFDAFALAQRLAIKMFYACQFKEKLLKRYIKARKNFAIILRVIKGKRFTVHQLMSGTSLPK